MTELEFMQKYDITYTPMKLPDNIKLLTDRNNHVHVVMDGKDIGYYYARYHFNGGYRYKTPNGAFGDCARPWDAMVALVELSRQ